MKEAGDGVVGVGIWMALQSLEKDGGDLLKPSIRFTSLCFTSIHHLHFQRREPSRVVTRNIGASVRHQASPLRMLNILRNMKPRPPGTANTVRFTYRTYKL